MTDPGLAAPQTTANVAASAARRHTRWMQRLAEETSPARATMPTDAPAIARPSADTRADAPVDEQSAPGLGGSVLLVLGLLWLAATMWTAHASIVGNVGDAAIALGSAAGALPSVIAASLLAGGTAGLAAGARFAPDRGPGAGPSVLRRLLIGIAGGAVCGALATGAILFAYGSTSAIALLAITVGAAGVLGGAAAALPRPVFAAGLVATFVVFILGVVFNMLQPRLTTLFGAGDTAASQASASRLFAYTQAIVSGVVAGIAGYRYLRRRDERAWPWYLLAGALPGLLLLLTEVLTRVGGSSLLRVVKSMSEGDKALVEFIDFARLRNALVVLFVGGIAAMIAVGRTLRNAEDDPDASG